MKKSDKNKILIELATLNDKELEDKYYKSVLDCLGSEAEKMRELDYDVSDIKDREQYETYLCEYSSILGEVCKARKIELWKN